MKVPYSARTKYNNFDSFLVGLNLDYFFKGSGSCINSFVGFADDTVYLSNNFTLSKPFNSSVLIGPFLNFTGLLGRNLDNVLPNCYTLWENFYAYEVTQFQQFNNSVG